jgi:hypothetical protein
LQADTEGRIDEAACLALTPFGVGQKILERQDSCKEGKHFFFEKKKQKTFTLLGKIT